MIHRKNNHPLAYTAFTMAAAVAVVVLLFFRANQPILQKNGFSRQFTEPAAQVAAIRINLRGEITAISGATGSHLYFQTKNPEQLLVTDHRLRDRKYLSFNLPNDETTRHDKTIASRFNFLIDSPLVHILAGNVPAILSGHLPDRTLVLYRFPPSLFTRAIAVSPRSFILRGYDTSISKSNQLFMKVDPVNGIVYNRNNLPEQQGDLVSTDGLLHYDSVTHLLAYVSFYANRILCLDTNLNLVYKGHTVDTFSAYQTRAGNLVAGKKTIQTNTAPSRFINRESCVADGRLFNNSALKADNETNREFAGNAVIDVYDLKDGSYLSSFYIPAFRDENLRRFSIFGNLVVVVYNSYIVTYHLPPIDS